MQHPDDDDDSYRDVSSYSDDGEDYYSKDDDSDYDKKPSATKDEPLAIVVNADANDDDDDDAVDVLFEDDDEPEVCPLCACSPCEWDEYSAQVMQQDSLLYNRVTQNGVTVVIDDQGAPVSNATMRFHLYYAFTYAKFGHLGAGHRIPLPTCARDKIRAMYPDPDGNYVGFHADAAGTQPDEDNESNKNELNNGCIDETPFL
jgi:hypothetical protein